MNSKSHNAVSEKSGKSSLLKAIASLAPYISKADKIRFGVLFCCMVIGAVLDLLGLGLIPAVIVVSADPSRLDGFPFLQQFTTGKDTLELLTLGLGLVALAFVIKSIYFLLLFRFQFRLIAKQRENLSKQLFAVYMNAPWQFHLNRNSSELLRNVSVETNEVINGIVLPIATTSLGLITTLVIVIANLVFLPAVCVIALVIVLGIVGGVMFILRYSIANAGKEAKHQRKRTILFINEGLSAVLEWKLYAREHFIVKRFQLAIRRFARSDSYKKIINASLPYGIETVAVASIFLVLLILSQVGATLTELTSYLSVMAISLVRLRQSVTKVFSGLGQLMYSRPSVETVVADLEALKSPPKESPTHFEPMHFEQHISIDEVQFTFDGAESHAPTLQNLSLEIPKGKSIAFVGPTGSGKSTIVNLLLGFLKPTHGSVKVDGKEILDNLPGWQRRIGYVPQSILLLDDTIANNVAFGLSKDERDLERIKHVLQLAQLNIEDEAVFPLGLQTVVGERGVRISGGQRQRLGIARALYREPSVIIMDEATSALDTRTEANLIEMLKAISGDITFVYVAHRISTVEHCDKIFCIKAGRVVDEGNHEELFETSSLYKSLAS